jgi:hypothetical protein
LLVLGPQEGIALIEDWPGAEALLLDEDGEAWRTSGWQDETQFEPLAPDVGTPDSSDRREVPIQR